MTDASATVETQLALINQKLDGLIQQTTDRGTDHETRLRKLEQRVFLIVGAAAATGGGAGWLAQFLGH